MRCMTLSASIAVDGRPVTLYEQVFEYKDYNSPRRVDKTKGCSMEVKQILLSRCLH
ncbi:hypothetical protein [Vibrio sp. qd031]|uniref:hypothetical protein n=1 Tax=Vibrio sp. qd031 TaxID=1603038 RepID=UPI00155388A5|nr:hypothetical protein [Vibrio sp. qd031]